jgi:hypothetical protein
MSPLTGRKVEIEERLIILPCDPEFHQVVGWNLPPDWKAVADRIGERPTFIVDASSGLMRPATPDELDEYVYGGEYDERLEQIGQADDLA